MLSCDKFGYRLRTMFLDQNEVSLFQKPPWNALCKNGILLKIPPFSKPNFKEFSIKHHNTVISVDSKAFRCCRNHKVTLLKNPEDSTEFQKKSSFSRKLKITKFEP